MVPVHLHGFYGIVGFLDGIDWEPLGGMRKNELIDDLDVVSRRAQRCESNHLSFSQQEKVLIFRDFPIW